MPKPYIPTPHESFNLIRNHGDQFINGRHLLTLENGLTIDREVLAAQGNLYSDDPLLGRELEKHDIPVASLEAAKRCIAHYFDDPTVILGVSGFATAGFDYDIEAQAINRLHDHVGSRQLPQLVADGGVSAGNLGLSGTAAGIHGVDSMGFIPHKGLDSVGVRDHMIIWGEKYRDREVLVGTLPDILVCIGGGEGTMRECQQALKVGSSVLLIALKEYGPHSLPNTYIDLEGAEAAERAGRLEICDSLQDLPEKIDALLLGDLHASRDKRLSILHDLLKS